MFKRIILFVILIGVFFAVLAGGVHRFLPFIWKYDKLGHALLYFCANLFCYLILFFPNKKYLLKTAYFVFSVGLMEEVRQVFTYRGFSFLDIIANFVGILLSVLLIKLLYENRKNRKKSIPN